MVNRCMSLIIYLNKTGIQPEQNAVSTRSPIIRTIASVRIETAHVRDVSKAPWMNYVCTLTRTHMYFFHKKTDKNYLLIHL